MPTSTIALTTAFASLGTGPMLIAGDCRMGILAASASPAATAAYMPLDADKSVPFYFPFTQTVWGRTIDATISGITPQSLAIVIN